MINIVKLSTLQGAERFGNCASCGRGSQETENYRMVCQSILNQQTSLTLCGNCMKLLAKTIRLTVGDEGE